jgi:protein-export membrane protein SecD/preprotein translocase SecF subunit
MFSSLRNRFLVIAALVAASVFALVPRSITVRERDPQTGVIVDRKEKQVPLKRGLDLQGGMHLGLELDQSRQVSADPAKDLDLALTILRKRVDEFGVTEPLIQKVGDDRIVVELAGITDPARAKSIVQKSAFLEFRITDETNSLEKALPAMDRTLRSLGVTSGGASGGPAKPNAVEALLGGDSAKATPDSGKRGGAADSTKKSPADSAKAAADSAPVTDGVLSSLVSPSGANGMPGEYMVAETAYPRVDSLLNLPQIKRLLPRGVELRWAAAPTSVGVQSYRFLYALEDKPLITGSSLVDARAELDPLTNAPMVSFDLDRAGGRKFGEGTGRHVNDYMAILLDGRVQGRPPVIQSRIEKSGRITLGGKTIQEAQDLALTLKAGALPIPLKIVEEREVGATLGADSIRGGMVAGLVGTLLVVLIMVGYYALAGIMAVAALAIYVLMALGGLSMMGATLTLPGLAGLILSIGIAVDANVLIFERIREELRHGKTVRLAIEEGFRHALPAIIDSSVSTVLTALFLFQFGTGPVQGFAVTLVVGILASLITAIFVTRTFFLLWLQRNPNASTINLGKLKLFADAKFDFIGVRRRAYALTAAVLIPGLIVLAVRGLNYSIEFTGGTLLQVRAHESVNVGDLRAGLDREGLRGAEIQQFGAPGEYLLRARVGEATPDANNTQATAAVVRKALDNVLGAGKYTVARTEAVGPKVGGELRQQAFLAIFLSFFAVLAYLAYRFEWRFGLAAVLATAHDIVATIAFVGVMHLEVSLVVVAGLLTMVGYSLNDTIIIFDRVRENLKKHQRMGFAEILNLSINETLPRSILTHTTTLATLLALAIFGGEVIRPFALVMFFGVFTGTFSSIYIASPVLMAIEKRWPGPAARAARGKVPAAGPSRGKVQPAG